jgi:thiamine pyrophosphate-dependent enzyme
MPLMSGGDAVVRSLLAHEISTIYCLPGVQSDHLFNAMFDAGDALSVVHTRHEQGAALRRSAPHPRPASPPPIRWCPVWAFSTAARRSPPPIRLVRACSRSSARFRAAPSASPGLLHEIPD